MYKFIWKTGALGATLVSALIAQNYQRQATMVGGGDRDRGKCTIEVVVDDVAQVEIRGTSAILRTLSGQAAQWRRFECNAPMPPNPVGFRFAGVDGRGRQSLVRDPRGGGPVVVQIEDKDSGAEGYTFDIFWDQRGGGGYAPPIGAPPPPPSPNYRDDDRGGNYRPGYRDGDYFRRYGHGFGADEAIRVCERAIAEQAGRRFRDDIHFGRIRLDDGPVRQDWVVGWFDVHRRDREERYRFSCSVDFQSGRVRSADIDPRPF